MNTQQAKSIQLVDLLDRLGHQPVRIAKNNTEYWYRAPFRDEKDASFKVDTTNNMFYDFGLGKGAKGAIDFIMLYKQCSVSEALMHLKDFASLVNDSVLSNDESTFKQRESGIKVESVKTLSHPALLQYLQKRGIPVTLAKSYLQEIHFTFEQKNKSYFALGFANDKGGYELRNTYQKLSTSPKYMTNLTGKDASTVHVLEGFFDFLSWMVLHNHSSLPTDVLVLNSLSFVPNALAHIAEKHYQHVHTWLDSNASKAREIFATLSCSVTYNYTLYQDYDDLNDYLINSVIQKDMFIN